jgi:DNA-binding PadR family transcriptional regulator
MNSPLLKPQWFQILLALSSEDRHGYGIQRVVLEQTEGHMRLWPAMLYRSLTKLEEGGLIRRINPPDDEPEDERRQYYTLTKEGRVRLKDEAGMLARWAAAARGEQS